MILSDLNRSGWRGGGLMEPEMVVVALVVLSVLSIAGILIVIGKLRLLPANDSFRSESQRVAWRWFDGAGNGCGGVGGSERPVDCGDSDCNRQAALASRK